MKLFRYRLRGFVVLFHRFHPLAAVSKLMKITPTSIKMLYFIFRIHFFKIVNVWRLEYVEGREYLGNTTQVKTHPSQTKPNPFQTDSQTVPFLQSFIPSHSDRPIFYVPER